MRATALLGTAVARLLGGGVALMRALYAGGGEPPHFREVPEPAAPSPLDAIVEPIAVAICDLDLAYVANLLPTAAPYAVGHEFTARVVDIGEQVRTVSPGDVVAVPFQISCGACDRCRSGRTDDCTTVPYLSTYGLEPFGGGNEWGAAATERVRVPFADAMCVPLPPSVDAVLAASISDNVVDGYSAVASNVGAGDSVVIFGSASVGLYAAATAIALGAPCTYVDDDPARLAVAEALGADVPWVDLYKRGVTLTTGRPAARASMPAVVELVADGRLRIDVVGADVVPFDGAPDALVGPLPHKTILDMGTTPP